MTPSTLFPRETLDWRTLQLPRWRTLSMSALALGAAVGVPLRLFRAWALTHELGAVGRAAAPSAGFLVGIYAVRAVVLCGALTLHLAHFPVRRWAGHLLRFCLAVALAELVTSALLVALGLEPLGTTGRARWGDLPVMAGLNLGLTVVALGAFTAVLAGIVQLVRTLMARRGRHAHLHVMSERVAARDAGAGTGPHQRVARPGPASPDARDDPSAGASPGTRRGAPDEG